MLPAWVRQLLPNFDEPMVKLLKVVEGREVKTKLI
jgi:hypothetical protein